MPWDDVGGRVMRTAFMRRWADIFREAGDFAARSVPGVERYEFAPDSGGAGKFRGGRAQGYNLERPVALADDVQQGLRVSGISFAE